MLFWREGWSLRQDFTAPDFISCFYLDLEGVACGLSCLHSITPAVGGRMSCCWARFNSPSQSWTVLCCGGNVGMAFPTHPLNESCCQDCLWEHSLAWEAVIKWKRSHASRRWNWDMNHALRPPQITHFLSLFSAGVSELKRCLSPAPFHGASHGAVPDFNSL